MQESKTDINQRDSNGKQHGYWEVYYINGILRWKGTFHHGNTHGYWESYLSNGTIWYKGTYHHGEKVGCWVWCNTLKYYYARM